MTFSPKVSKSSRLSRRQVLLSTGAITIDSLLMERFAFAKDKSRWEFPYENVDPPPKDFFGIPEDKPETFTLALARSRILSSQLFQGLSYIGQPSDFVTRYDIEAFRVSLKTLFDIAGPAEESRLKFLKDRKISEDKATHFDEQIHSSASLQASQQAELQRVTGTIRENISTMTALNPQIDAQRDLITSTQLAFDDACKQFSNGGCGISDLLHGLSAFIGIISSVYTGGASVLLAVGTDLGKIRSGLLTAGSAANPNDLIRELRQGFTSAVDVIDKVDGEWDSLQVAWTKSRLLLAPPSSKAKVLTDATKLEGQLARFEGQVDASPVDQELKSRFKRQVRQFYVMVQLRNNKLLEIDTLYLRNQSLQQELQIRVDEQLKLGSLKASLADPDADEYGTLLSQMSAALLESVRSLVWEETRSLWLWSLEPPPAGARLDGITFTDLSFAHGLIQSESITRESLAPGNAERIPAHTISFAITSDMQESLGKTGRLVLDVTRPLFPSTWYAIYVTEIAVGVKGMNAFEATLTHPGRAAFEGPEGPSTMQMFSMSPDTRTVTNKFPADLGAQTGKYVGLSPYTQWLLAFTAPQFEELRTITEVSFTFRGWHRTRQA